MIIDNVNCIGFEDMYNYLQEQYKDWTSRRINGTNNKYRALNYCEVDFEISDFSPMEFLFLQGFSNGNVVYRGEISLTSETIPEETPENEREIISKAVNFNKQIELNDEADDYVGDMARFPAMDRCKAIVRFKGVSILDMMHCTNMTTLFGLWLKDIAVRDGESGVKEIKFPLWADIHKEISEVKPKLSLEDYFTQGFLTNYYKYWRDMIKAQDIASNAYVHNRSYAGLSYNQPVLQEIRFPEGSICLGSSDAAKIGDNIAKLNTWAHKEAEHSLDELIPIHRMTLYSEVDLTINMKTSLMTFLWFVKHLPYRMINDYEEILVVMGMAQDVPIEDAENFRVRKGQTTKKTWELIESYHETNPLRMMDFIPYETMISYTIMGSVADFGILTNTLRHWMGAEDEQHDRLDVKELRDIVNSIDNFIQMVRGTTSEVDYQ